MNFYGWSKHALLWGLRQATAGTVPLHSAGLNFSTLGNGRWLFAEAE